MILVITNAIRAAVAQTLHNLLKTLHKCVECIFVMLSELRTGGGA